jgi:hypothetical protein
VQACDSNITFIHEGKQVSLKVEVINLSERTVKEGKLSGSMAKALTVHVSMRIPHGKLFKLINMKMVKEAWSNHGFLVLKSNRSGVKFEGTRLREKGLDSAEYHLDEHLRRHLPAVHHDRRARQAAVH